VERFIFLFNLELVDRSTVCVANQGDYVKNSRNYCVVVLSKLT